MDHFYAPGNDDREKSSVVALSKYLGVFGERVPTTDLMQCLMQPDTDVL